MPFGELAGAYERLNHVFHGLPAPKNISAPILESLISLSSPESYDQNLAWMA